MKQKLLGSTLYVFQVEPYQITEDTDAEVIKVQEECVAGFKELNASLANKIVAYNYHVMCVNIPEWAPYVDDVSPELAWSANSATVTIGADDNVFPTLTNPHSVTVTYSSSDTTKATINASTGAITLAAAGNTTISATFAGNDTYYAQTVSYTLTVEEAQKQSPELAWSSDAEAVTIGGDNNNLIPTLSNPHSVTVTYSSSDTEKATIDESTGEITLVSEGETTISAIFAGDDTYEAQTVTYILSVEAAVAAEEEEPTTYYYTMYATNDPSDTTATDTGTFTSDNSVARTEDLGDGDVDFVAFEITSSTAEPQLEGETLYANYEVMDYIDTTTRFQLYADVDGTLTVNEVYVVISTTDPAQNL